MKRKHQRQAYAQRRNGGGRALDCCYNTFGKSAGGAVGAAMGQGGG